MSGAGRLCRWTALAAIVAACTADPERLNGTFAEAKAKTYAGQVSAALELSRKGRFLSEGHEGLESWYWRFTLLESELLGIRGDGAASEALARLSLPPHLSSGSLEARRLKILARHLVVAGRRDEGLRLIERAEQLLVSQETPDLAVELTLLRGRVLFEKRGSEPDAAHASEVLFRRAEEQAAGANLPYWQATALNHLAFVRMSEQEYDQALTLFEKTVALARSAGAEMIAGTAAKNAAECLINLGELERARAMLQQAVNTLEQLGVVKLRQAALGQLGMALAAQGDLSGALTYWRQALDLARTHGAAYVPIWAQHAAAAYIQLGNWDQARRLNDEAASRARQRQDTETLLGTVLNEARIAAGTGDLPRAEQLITDVLARAGKLRSLRWEAKAEMAEVKARQGQDREAKDWFGQALAAVGEAQEALAADEHRLTFLAALLRLHRRYVDWLVARGQTTTALEVAESSRARVLQIRLGRGKAPRALTAAELQERARLRGETFISYWVGPQRSFAWLVTPADIQMAVLPGEARLQALVQSYRRNIENSLRSPLLSGNSPGSELYRVVLPFASALPVGARVVLAPDGPLHALPFGALVVSDRGPPHYLIDDVTLARAPSLFVLPERTESSVELRSSTALAVGAPVARGRDFPALPYALDDLRAVARSFRETVTLSGSEATPDGFLRSDLQRFGVIHIAAHAVATPLNPLDANIVLSPGAQGDRLGVRDLMAAPVQSQLVTISACRSAGVGSYAGEGLVGLAWAFLTAGAGRVIAGLWDVPDESTGALMTRLYEGIRDGSDPVSALRDAQRGLLHGSEKWRQPWHWAAFELWLGSSLRPKRS
jgi:CHAT domain-containing protein